MELHDSTSSLGPRRTTGVSSLLPSSRAGPSPFRPSRPFRPGPFLPFELSVLRGTLPIPHQGRHNSALALAPWGMYAMTPGHRQSEDEREKDILFCWQFSTDMACIQSALALESLSSSASYA